MTASPTKAVPPPPAELAAYVRAVGVERTVALVLEFGGAPLYFAKKASTRSKVAAVVGADGVEALARELGAGALRVPLCKRWIARYLSAHDLSVHEIARRMRATDVSVRAWLKGETPRGRAFTADPAQLSLLDD